eukprot:COSAG03_NODE_1464_length_4033_cov_2.296645_4_plen_254_part_00
MDLCFGCTSPFSFVVFPAGGQGAFSLSWCTDRQRGVCHVPHRPADAFHTTGNTSWQHYDWDQITTVCVFGAVDPLMLCKAHSVGARVTLGAGGPPKGSWNDSAAVSTWVKQSVARVQTAKVDGLNLDVEISQDDPQQLAGLVPACKQMADAMHAAQPGSHVSFDTPSEGETGSTQAECGDMYGRDYDYKALAQVLDFFVVMDYDSNDDGGKPCPTCYLANAALPVIKHGNAMSAHRSVPSRTARTHLLFCMCG